MNIGMSIGMIGMSVELEHHLSICMKLVLMNLSSHHFDLCMST